MGKNDYLKSRERQIELLVLGIFTFYDIFVLFVGYKKEWNPYLHLTTLLALVYPWVLYIGKYLNYRSRAYTTAYMCMTCLLIYDFQVDNLLDTLTTFIALVVLVGLYGIPNLMKIMAVCYSLMLFYFIFYKQTLIFGGFFANVRNILQICSVYLVVYVIHYMVKRNLENKNSMMEMIEALQHSERVKDDFLANVSHEIRTPVNTIHGISEIMLNKDIPEHLHEDLFNIQTAGKNLMAVVSDILDFSELQNGEFELMEENYYISSTIYDVINLSVAKKNEKRLQFIVDCDATMPSILIGDEQKLRRVLLSVVDNAIKFTNEGCVRIQIGYRKEEYGINLIISVKDSGIGMTEDTLEKVFESFTQMDMSRKRNIGGVGLGLAISKTIVHKMGGFLTAQSQLGKGTEVQFVIPQRVYDETPIATIENKENLNVAAYIDMEQFEIPAIRDEYARNITHMIEQLNVKCHMCRNLAELKRRDKAERFTHVFISLLEYLEDPEYFDALAKQTNVNIIIDDYDDMKVRNKDLNRVYKPFFILSIVSALNNTDIKKGGINIEIAPETVDISGLHVLIVDDNKMNIRVLEGLLEEYNLQTSYALSGKEALSMIESKEYDLVFMDHMMPEMDGVETFHRIRKKRDDYFKNVPIIALTANAIAGAREMFMKEGFNDFVSKPVESSVLLRVLKKHLLINRPKERVNKESARAFADKIARKTVEQELRLPIVEPKKESESVEEKLVVGDLDVQKGLTYCGNVKNYIMILQNHKETGRENMEHIQALYENENWNNYTISVHGAKSSMMSIGAVELSVLAKDLEMAGRRMDVSYIKANHEAMMKEYERVITILEECPLLAAETSVKSAKANEGVSTMKGEPSDVVTKPELDNEKLKEHLKNLEDAAYGFDGEKMLAVLDEIAQYSYNGRNLDEITQKVMKKVGMSDYFSAYETVEKEIQKLDK